MFLFIFNKIKQVTKKKREKKINYILHKFM